MSGDLEISGNNATESQSKILCCLDYFTAKVVSSWYYRMRTPIKVLVLWLGILSMSGIKAFYDVPSSFFSQKRNFLNMFFVKWSWLWTLTTLGLYMIVTSLVHGCSSWKRTVMASAFRLAVGTLVWYFWVNVVFAFVENLTGICLDRSGSPNLTIGRKRDCLLLKDGHVWDAIDISGHSFLLTYCILVCKSELNIQTNWQFIPSHAALYLPIGSKALSSLKSRFSFSLPIVQVLFLLNIFLALLWELMLITTCVYFHSFYSKAFGAACGIFSWLVTYNEWYKHQLSPGVPGKGLLGGLLLAKKTAKKVD